MLHEEDENVGVYDETEVKDEEEDFDDDDDNDDRDLKKRSWIREVRWAIRAGGLDDQVVKSHSGTRRITAQKRGQQRCDKRM